MSGNPELGSRKRGLLPPGRVRLAVTLSALAATSCVGQASGQSTQPSIDRFALDKPPAAHEELHRELREISGLALSTDGRLFAQYDERAFVYELDPMSGRTILRFRLGANGIRGDFEGIAFAQDRLFLVRSDGALFEFPVGEADQRVEHRRIRTRFRDRCEVEGLAYDHETHALLMACKTPGRRELEGHLVVFAYSLSEMALEEVPRVKVPFSEIEGVGPEGKLEPSGIEVDPLSGNWYILASAQGVLVELSSAGRVIASRKLSRTVHRQPEGITFASDGALLIGDEGRSGAGTLTRYAPLPGRGQE